MDAKNIFEMALARWGETPQLLMVIEECAELQKALLKYLRNKNSKEPDFIGILTDHIAEEIADVQIMIDQATFALGIGNKVSVFIENKLKRLLERMDADVEREKNADKIPDVSE